MSAEFESLTTHKGGTFTTSEANEYGISNERLRLLVKSGEIERASYGVYITPEEFEDKMFIVQKRRPKIIYSHATALYFHDLTDVTPNRYTVTVPTGYNTTTLRNDNFKVFTIKPELYETGITEGKTIFGHIVRIYDAERTICDCMRSRNKMDISILTDAVKRYARRKDRNIPKLMNIAKDFRVTKPLLSYLEVLL